MRGQSQAAPDEAVLEHVEQRPLREGPRRHRAHGQRHRLRDVHASARRPCRLEHKARKRPMGPDLPEGALPVLEKGIRVSKTAVGCLLFPGRDT